MSDESWEHLFEQAEFFEEEQGEADYFFDEPMIAPEIVMDVPSDPVQVLKKYFGYDSFRSGQMEAVENILHEHDTLAVMPTGAGKSICYQIPALMLPGITLVISPLISLMQDQVKSLNEAGIASAFINSSLSKSAYVETLQRARNGSYKIIYIAPERLMTEGFYQLCDSLDISMVTVDEAHCISQWGQDFRPSYLKIVEFIKGLKKRPIISAFTATATENVRTDIVCTLGLMNPFILVNGFDRENLFFQVDKPGRKDKYILDYVEQHENESGIIYCATRKNVEKVYELLKSSGVSVARYHAGLGAEERKKMQDDFVFDYTSVMVATNAFGMGIDKSNVRYVIHYNMPQSMENYYQEAGRAGRDGLDSKCILLFSAQDIVINRFLLENKVMSDMDLAERESVIERDNERLRAMEHYCYMTDCLRNYILNYFGEKTGKPCENCSNCLREFEELDMTAEAKQVINCVYEAKGRYGKNVILNTLAGANLARLRELHTTEYKTYGALADKNRNLMKRLVTQMLMEDYLVESGEYHVIRIGPAMPKLKDEATRVMIKIMEEDKKTAKQVKEPKQSKAAKAADLTSAGYKLFDELRALRTEIARKKNVPPYIVFNDKTLLDMCAKLPKNKEEMLDVSGVGEAKYEKYGEQFLGVIEKA